MDALARLVDVVGRHTPRDGIHDTPVPGLRLIRSSSPTLPLPVVYEPTLCLAAQGRKHVVVGNRSYDYDHSRYLVASVDLPVTGSVTAASEAEPYLCVALDLDMGELSDLALRYPVPPEPEEVLTSGIALNETTPQLLDAAARLASLLDHPADIDALAPLVTRELLYRVLTGPGNSMVRQLARADSRLNQIGRAIAWLRAHYQKPCRIEDLADMAGMSRSTFHLHFKAITAMSPLEYRAQLRLQEARRLMVAEAMDAAGAGFRVGYESPSQFSRDYVRMFGMPPVKDSQRLRDAVMASGAVPRTAAASRAS
ncbi:HTH araC/xylS-type domain-containing protein [Bordetella sputigena]|uniref:AraC family transcriptional regulator n=1 Tax=Bordetella sputigena TaxID=1416810 RepID=UPI0039EF7544